jgi:hypothetical protein
MALDPRAKYPSKRTYVVKLSNDAKPEALAGRLENLITGEEREFASGEQLLASLSSDIDGQSRRRSGHEPCK